MIVILIVLWVCIGFAFTLGGVIMLEKEICKLREALVAKQKAEEKWRADLLETLGELINALTSPTEPEEPNKPKKR